MTYILWFMGGILAAMLFVVVWRRVHAIGTIRVDHSDPTEPPYLFLELNEPFDKWKDEQYVLMRVKIKNYISPK